MQAFTSLIVIVTLNCHQTKISQYPRTKNEDLEILFLDKTQVGINSIGIKNHLQKQNLIFWDLTPKFWTGSTKWNTPFRSKLSRNLLQTFRAH